MRRLRAGSRGSKLARWQTEHVIRQLAPPCDVVVIHTTADQRQDVPLTAIGDKSLFLKEIEAALLDGSVDFAVHSLKDVPSRLDERFALAAILERADARDVVLPGGWQALPLGARVGSSSLRREAQLRALRPDLQFLPIRGNVDTRLRKLSERQYDGIVLAAAGLLRLDVPVPSEALIDISESIPAPGQAAICVEILAGNLELLSVLAPLDHAPTRAAVEAERAFAAALDAGCHVPLGAHAQTIADRDRGRGQGDGAVPAFIRLDTIVANTDGTRLIRTSGEGSDPLELGQRLAREAIARGAGELLRAN